MTLRELCLIYDNSACVGHPEGLEAVFLTAYLQGWCDGSGGMQHAELIERPSLVNLPAPRRVITVSVPDMR